MRIVVIGGSGHVGSFLVPRLVRAGHQVVNLTRGASTPYVADEAWSEVEQISVDRAAEDAAGTFANRVAALEAEVVGVRETTAREEDRLRLDRLAVVDVHAYLTFARAVDADDLAAEMLDHVVQRTGAAGLDRYEVSAYARPGHRCVHNLNYWQFGDYLGIGAGAHGKLTYPHRIVRQTRFRDPARYMTEALDGSALAQDVEVARDELAFEFMLNALRLRVATQ